MLVDGGRQCVCVSLCFMASVTHEPSTPSDVDHILQLGTDLYHSISTHRGYMLINEIPSTVNLAGRSLHFRVIESRGGSTAHAVDDLDALCFSIKGALKRCYEESDMCFMTVGNYPSCTIGTKKTADQMYLVMDSHSRDESGKSVPDGKAVVLRFRSLDQLVTYIREMCESLSSSDMPFEATSIACYPLDTVHSPIAPCEDVQDPSVEAGVDSQVNENETTSSEQSTPVTQCQQNASDHSDHEENDDVPVDDINTQSQLSSTASILCDIYMTMIMMLQMT
ncbi:unnamed protein product [Mytilus edulis]|uniref:Uncharacterized protein n=1 Tax=Mytilus edulis TaxID=6550 RepID=A0A8S3S0R4_MYTED|nr:unnamed protein product [Mytilus edulis]